MRRKLTPDEKMAIGTKCCNCGSTEELEYHHIIPLSLGGNDVLSNYCCLCYACHSLLHFGDKKKISHSQLTKNGIKVAKKNGKQIGAVKGKKLTTRKSIEAKELILKYNKGFGGSLSNEETWELIGISKMTFYKYKKELQQSLLSKPTSKE